MNIKPYQCQKLIQNQHVQQLIIIDKCSSTLDIANKWLQNNCLILSEAQTSGRGQYNKIWHSPNLSGIWGCYIIDEKCHALAIRAALALVYSLEQLGCPPSIKIKWPNDLYINNKKTAGFLIEGINVGKKQYWLIGFGITYKNIHKLNNLTPLSHHWKNFCPREELISTWINNLIEVIDKDNLALAYKPYDLLYKKTINGGIANGITENGELILYMPNGNITILNRNP